MPAVTAHRCLFADGPRATASTSWSPGGAGAVGHFAIELAKRGGARVVSTVSGPEKAELAAKAGADLVVNYTDPDAADQIRPSRPAGPHRGGRARREPAARPGAVRAADAPSSTYAAEPADPVLPVRACMTANVALRFVLLYGVPRAALLPGGAPTSPRRWPTAR